MVKASATIGNSLTLRMPSAHNGVMLRSQREIQRPGTLKQWWRLLTIFDFTALSHGAFRIENAISWNDDDQQNDDHGDDEEEYYQDSVEWYTGDGGDELEEPTDDPELLEQLDGNLENADASASQVYAPANRRLCACAGGGEGRREAAGEAAKSSAHETNLAFFGEHDFPRLVSSLCSTEQHVSSTLRKFKKLLESGIENTHPRQLRDPSDRHDGQRAALVQCLTGSVLQGPLGPTARHASGSFGAVSNIPRFLTEHLMAWRIPSAGITLHLSAFVCNSSPHRRPCSVATTERIDGHVRVKEGRRT